MKKKFFALLTAVVAVVATVSLSACGGHQHTYSQAKWGNDPNHHWLHCDEPSCNEQINYGEHEFNEGVCVCGRTVLVYYNFGETSLVTGPDGARPETDLAKIVIAAEYEGKPVTRIDNYAFHNIGCLTSITVPAGVKVIGNSAFSYCRNLTSITYKGTKAQWQAIQKGTDWNEETGDYTVHCTDGDILKAVS